MLKPSKFNTMTHNDSKELLVYNTLSHQMVKFDGTAAKEMEQLLLLPYVEEGPEILVQMKKKGIFVDENELEDLKADSVYLQLQAQSILQLTLLTTEQCNFRCTYCPEEFARGGMSRAVQDAIVNYVKKNITQFTGLRVMWFGGEPLLEKEMIVRLSKELKKICRNAKRTYTAQITTNGYHLDIDTFYEMMQANILQYYVTLDGFAYSHDAQRKLINGSGTYNRILKNLLDIKEKTATGRYRVAIRTNFTLEMIPDIGAYIDWFHQMFDNDPRFCLSLDLVKNLGGEQVALIKDSLIATER